MAILPLDQAIPRFKGNEERFDKFVNGTALQWYVDDDGTAVPTIQKWLADKSQVIDEEFAGPVAQAQAAAAAAQVSATAADASADAAQAILDEINASVTNIDEKVFFGDGVTTTFTLDRDPLNEENIMVWIGGAIQDTTMYSVIGSTLTITPAVPNGVKVRTVILTQVTSDGLIEIRDQILAVASGIEVDAFATAAQGDKADTAVQPNNDQGINQSPTTAQQPIPPGAFGGLFLSSAFASNVWTYLKNVADASTGPRFLASFASRVLGGHGNGPDQQRSIFWLLSEKLNWNNNTALGGEIDAITMQVRQGNLDDAGGILIDAEKVFDAGSTGGLTAIELASGRRNWAGTLLNKVRAIIGFQEGAGGALNGSGASFYAEAEAGSNHFGLAIVNHTAQFLHAIAGFTARNPASRWFSLRYDGNSVFELGSPTDSMKLRYVEADDAIKVQDETGTLNHYVMSKDGIFRARAGMIVADNQATLKRVLTTTASLDFASVPANNEATPLTVTVTGAQVGDSVIVNVTAGLFTGKLNYFGVVTSTNTVTIYCNNVSTGALDPGSQTFRVTILGF